MRMICNKVNAIRNDLQKDLNFYFTHSIKQENDLSRSFLPHVTRKNEIGSLKINEDNKQGTMAS